MGNCRPFLNWAGGKRWLAAKKLSCFPKSYATYYEPFLGSGAIFFSLSPTKAVLSDTNINLILTYKAIKSDWRTVLSYLQEHQKSHCKDYYYEVRRQVPEDDYSRAARLHLVILKAPNNRRFATHDSKRSHRGSTGDQEVSPNFHFSDLGWCIRHFYRKSFLSFSVFRMDDLGVF